MQFASGSLVPLSVQLGEVKALSEVLFGASINSLESIQRVRVSDDDIRGPQTDYIDEVSVTNQMAVVTPYVINFRSFTPELARVICGFANSSNSFIVKSISVEPAQEAASGELGQPGMENGAVPGMPPGAFGGGYPGVYGGGRAAAYARRYGYYPTPQPVQPPPPVVTGRGGLQTVLKEQLLHITIEVDLVKLLPKT